jgi:hypothetical protein
MSIEEALKLLQKYSCIQTKIVSSREEKESLKEAIALLERSSHSINLGACARNVGEGRKALQEYLIGLGYVPALDAAEASSPEGAVYLKYSTKNRNCYLDTYTGTYRGVLISYQSENENLVGTFGHFPLDLFS